MYAGEDGSPPDNYHCRLNLDSIPCEDGGRQVRLTLAGLRKVKWADPGVAAGPMCFLVLKVKVPLEMNGTQVAPGRKSNVGLVTGGTDRLRLDREFRNRSWSA